MIEGGFLTESGIDMLSWFTLRDDYLPGYKAIWELNMVLLDLGEKVCLSRVEVTWETRPLGWR